MSTLPLSESAAVILDASGNGTAKLGPHSRAVSWHPTTVSVKTSTNVKTPTCYIYAGDFVGDQNFIDGTYTGNADSTSNISGTVIYLSGFIWAVWTGGDAGAQATVTIAGTQEIGGP